MGYVVVDVESDGPIPADFSMVCFGAVIFDDRLDKVFYGRTRPISDKFIPEGLVVNGFSREQHLNFEPKDRDGRVCELANQKCLWPPSVCVRQSSV